MSWPVDRRRTNLLNGSSSMEMFPGVFSKTIDRDWTVLNFAGTGSTNSTKGRAGKDGVPLFHDFLSFLPSL